MTRHTPKLLLAAAMAACPLTAFVACSGDDTAVNPADAGSDAVTSDADAARDTGPDVRGIDTDAEAGLSFNLWPPGEGPIVYYGGPVMLGTPNVYYVWYGDWKGSNTPSILEDLIKGFSGTGYSAIMKGYYQTPQAPLLPPTDAGLEGGDAGVDVHDGSIQDAGPKENLSGNVSFARSIYVGYTRGKDLHDSDIRGIVQDLLRAGDLPYDSDGIYFVLTSNDVIERDDYNYSGFCTDYCGWHDGTFVDQVQVHYAFIGSGCLDWCTLQTQFVEAGIPQSPNGNWDADGMASVIIHELCESVTDPMPSNVASWQDSWMSSENGDMCAWRFDPTYPTLDSSRANVRFGGRDFLIQQMWVNDGDGGRCDLQP